MRNKIPDNDITYRLKVLRNVYPTWSELRQFKQGKITFNEIRDWITEISEAKTQEEYTKILNDRYNSGHRTVENEVNYYVPDI